MRSNTFHFMDITWTSIRFYPFGTTAINTCTLREQKIKQFSKYSFINRLLNIINTYWTGRTFFKKHFSSKPSPRFCIITTVKDDSFPVTALGEFHKVFLGFVTLWGMAQWYSNRTPITDKGHPHDPLPFCSSWQFTVNCPLLLKTPGKWVIPSNWVSPGRSRSWGRKLSSPEAPCWLLDQWPVSAGSQLMMLEPAPASLPAMCTLGTHTQDTGFWKSQVIASFCSTRNFLLKVYTLHFMFLGSALRFEQRKHVHIHNGAVWQPRAANSKCDYRSTYKGLL